MSDDSPGKEAWSDLEMVAATIALEAAAEPYVAKLAVGYVIRNRMNEGTTWKGVCLRPWQFSCWNDDYKVQAEARLRLRTPTRADSWRAAMSAIHALEEDPTKGATHYLNIELTKKIRSGALPAWAENAINEGRVTAEIGKHTFMRLK
jgi:spore germination cell wall hydrolase CwlJ-like protein|tara:strand:- start:426 stop:869 length:444 start_codon:yes stop_codon:yes gene_type:complete